MEAGQGAEEQASRRGRRIERLRREKEAADTTASGVEAALERAQREQRNWAVGAEGERQVAESLTLLARYGWVTLNDVHWPGRPQANIDHIAIGPAGVAIIDAKNWSGEVTLAAGTLRQNGYSRDREVQGVAAATAAVTALLAPQHRNAVFGLICLASHDQAPVTTTPGVRVVGRLQLATFLSGLDPRLSPYDVADLGRYLGRTLGGPSNTPPVTTAALTGQPRRMRGVQAPTGSAPSAYAAYQLPPQRPGRARPARARGAAHPSSRRPAKPSCLGQAVKLGVIVVVLFLALANVGRIAEAFTSIFTPATTTSVPAVAPVP